MTIRKQFIDKWGEMVSAYIVKIAQEPSQEVDYFFSFLHSLLCPSISLLLPFHLLSISRTEISMDDTAPC